MNLERHKSFMRRHQITEPMARALARISGLDVGSYPRTNTVVALAHRGLVCFGDDFGDRISQPILTDYGRDVLSALREE